MRLKAIDAKNIPPVKRFKIDDLADVIVLAGPNGVGKTKLIQGLLQYFQNPQPNPERRLLIEATSEAEVADWGKNVLDTNIAEDSQKLLAALQKGKRRSNWESSVLNFESDRSIQQITPYSFNWDAEDPFLEIMGWNMGFSNLRDRFQDTLHSLFRKVRSRREQISARAEELFKNNPDPRISLERAEFPDPLEPFKEAFRQLLAPKELLDADPKNQTLNYIFEGQTLPISSLSSGEREVVNIVFDFLLRNPTDCIVIFDEPELHLHPELSYKLLQTLRGIGSNNQFIFCTHSPDIITASLDSSVIFIAPPKDSDSNQAIVVREEDETHQALKFLGQSIGIISLGKKIVLIEGTNSSLDKQTYGTILKNRFPNLVLVPGGGKGLLTSFAFLHKEVLERTIWGVEFFMLCDRDAVPPSRSGQDLEAEGKGRLKILKKYHLENYFLDEAVLAKVFEDMEPEGSWLRSTEQIRSSLKEIAREIASYTTALTTAAYFRETVGNIDIMAKDCRGKTADELVALITKKSSDETKRIDDTIECAKVETYVRDTMANLIKSLDEDTEDWKNLTPGRPLLHGFARKANLNATRLKVLYMKAAEKHVPYPFQDVVDIFSHFNTN
jgi:hypothetical protein